MEPQALEFARLIAQEQERPFDRLDAKMRWVFSDIDLTGMRILEIGAGNGAFACWCAVIGGASSIVALEPESDGSNTRVLERFRTRVGKLGLRTVEIHALTFQHFEAPRESFDLILSYASVNHLSEPDCMRLHEDPKSTRVYIDLFSKMNALLKPGGHLLISDCSRYHFWAPVQRLGIPINPLTKDIEWDKHQPPRMWRKLLEKAAFIDVSWRWSQMTPLRPLGSLATNALFAFFTHSAFDLRARKPGPS